MEITLVTEKNKKFFEPLLPASIWDWADFVLGAVEGKTACGVVAVEESGTLLEILYLYVAEDFRRKGIATELLNALHEVGRLSQMDGEVCQYIYGQETSGLDACLFRNLFQGDDIKSQVYTMEIKDLCEKFFNRSLEGTGGRILPLSRVTARIWNQFLDRLDSLPDKEGIIPSLDSIYLYDKDASFLLIKKGKAAGCSLLERAEDGYIFSYFCVLDGGTPAEMIRLLRSSYEVLKEKCKSTDKVYINALTETAEKMVLKLTDQKAKPVGQAVARYYVY